MTKVSNRTRARDFQTIWVENFSRLLDLFLGIVQEIYLGVRARALPWTNCFLWGTIANVLVIYRIDNWLLKHGHLEGIYPVGIPYIVYSLLISISPILLWAFYRVLLKRRLLRRLTSVFHSIGLKNGLGILPRFVSDKPLDAWTRILRLKKENLPKNRFIEAKSSLESALQVYVDEIKEHISSGTIDIIYAHKPMPQFLTLDCATLPPDQIIVGSTRSGNVTASFSDVPHLLVAGQTGGGKSTCLRQWITTLLVSNPNYKFTLIDLKGGLEFQIFEGLKQVFVAPDLGIAVGELRAIAEELEQRKEILKSNHCKDIEAFRKIPVDDRLTPKSRALFTSFDRHIIVIDEVAELFLSGAGFSAKDTQSAREATGKIARQGRAVGLHLIVGTQRPDARALDTQIKANMTGKICFQMADQHSSLVVLGNARAKDLPPVAGRAIWQNGMKQIEVQIPFLDIQRTEELLTHLRTSPALPPSKYENSILQ